ncbi:hypothetical protein [Litchfieldia alkalitelluris]|uniref:hypothetical protein n=1 Tax=Litchfieldia alkalitelluris TaxID=304268 RepID=UPI00099625D7|nr:hypothetical protein [Litchfieldia alkalitelluris]
MNLKKLPVILFLIGLSTTAFATIFLIDLKLPKDIVYLLLALGIGFWMVSGRVYTTIKRNEIKDEQIY